MIIDKIVQQGQVMFKYRSFLPLVILPLVVYYGYRFALSHNVADEHLEDYLFLFSVIISFVGFFLRCAVVGHTPPNTSGRNTSEQKADVLNTTGIYSLLRHPLYVANYFVFLGFLLVYGSIEFVLIATILFYVYYERIAAAEENFLSGKFGVQYKEWSDKTPAFFPNFKNWQSPERKFSVKKVLRREPPGFLLVCFYFFLVDFVEDVFLEKIPFIGWAEKEPQWLTILSLGLAVYFVLKILRRKTKLLDV
jgi:protein-S-isoprenylcysteine O-methyltransferase Ste14